MTNNIDNLRGIVEDRFRGSFDNYSPEKLAKLAKQYPGLIDDFNPEDNNSTINIFYSDREKKDIRKMIEDVITANTETIPVKQKDGSHKYENRLKSEGALFTIHPNTWINLRRTLDWIIEPDISDHFKALDKLDYRFSNAYLTRQKLKKIN